MIAVKVRRRGARMRGGGGRLRERARQLFGLTNNKNKEREKKSAATESQATTRVFKPQGEATWAYIRRATRQMCGVAMQRQGGRLCLLEDNGRKVRDGDQKTKACDVACSGGGAQSMREKTPDHIIMVGLAVGWPCLHVTGPSSSFPAPERIHMYICNQMLRTQ